MALRSQRVAWMSGVLAAALALSLEAGAKDPPHQAGKSEKAEKGKPSEKSQKGKPSEKSERGGPAQPAAVAKAEGQARANEVRAEPAKQAAAERAERSTEGGEPESKVAELRKRQARGQLSKQELKKELAALRESRGERTKARREALRQRWGGKLAEAPAQQELQHHERRMARLERMALLAQTERSGAAKAELLARIEKLTARETERHERKMSKLEAKAGNTRPASAAEPLKGAAANPPTPAEKPEKKAENASKGAAR